jgi:hypothetical protein
MDIYDELMKRPDYDRNLHSYKACCHYALSVILKRLSLKFSRLRIPV